MLKAPRFRYIQAQFLKYTLSELQIYVDLEGSTKISVDIKQPKKSATTCGWRLDFVI